MLLLGKVHVAVHQSNEQLICTVDSSDCEQCVAAGGDILFALQAVRAWVAAFSNSTATVGDNPVLQPLLEQVRQCGAGGVT